MRRKILVANALVVSILYALMVLVSLFMLVVGVAYYFFGESIQIVTDLLLPLVVPFLVYGKIGMVAMLGALLFLSIYLKAIGSKFNKYSFYKSEKFKTKKAANISYIVMFVLVSAYLGYILYNSMLVGGVQSLNIIIYVLLAGNLTAIVLTILEMVLDKKNNPEAYGLPAKPQSEKKKKNAEEKKPEEKVEKAEEQKVAEDNHNKIELPKKEEPKTPNVQVEEENGVDELFKNKENNEEPKQELEQKEEGVEQEEEQLPPPPPVLPEKKKKAKKTKEELKVIDQEVRPPIYTAGLDDTTIETKEEKKKEDKKEEKVQKHEASEGSKKLIESIGKLDAKRQKGEITSEEYTRLRAELIKQYAEER